MASIPTAKVRWPFLMQKIALTKIMLALVCAANAAEVASVPLTDGAVVQRRVEGMLGKLSLEQKLHLIGGDGFRTFALPEIGLPVLDMANGTMGVSSGTAFAGGLSLAAAWNPALAKRMGIAIGDDALARGIHFMLGPGVNLYRTPLNGRNFEYFGEDPYLASRTVVNYIEGIQAKGVVATVKHFAAYNATDPELSADMDERTLHELYLPAFEASVREAKVGAVMSAYNRLNGDYCSESTALIQILKKDWGFDGILMSDWGAVHSGLPTANAGLDLEMPAGRYLNTVTLAPAIKTGEISIAMIDDKVRRILRIAVRFGFLDHAQLHPEIPLYNTEAKAVALDTAREGIVLLKNQEQLLPLDPHRIRTLAVIGPTAYPACPTGGGSSARVIPYEAKSFLTGIADFLGAGVRVLYVPTPNLPPLYKIIQTTEYPAEGGEPVTVEVFNNPRYEGPPIAAGHAVSWQDAYHFLTVHPGPFLRRSGRYTPKTSGPYLLITEGGDHPYRMTIADQTFDFHPSGGGRNPGSATVVLTAGQPVSWHLDYTEDASPPFAGFVLMPLDEVVPETVKQVAAMADAAVVCVGFNSETEAEGVDRSFWLPYGQDQLIQAVASANSHTIVTLTSGGGVDMRSWIDQVPGILETWYAGQEGGTALAEILFGARSPEGHLPVTFEHSWEENPVFKFSDPVVDPATGVSHLRYGEGVFLGYRYYTTQHQEPLFPFGFGLSYTTFAFSHLTVPAAASAAEGIDVACDVTNTGDRAGAEVVQVYVGDPSAGVPRPAKELKGFQKVRLQPGETKHVALHLDRRAFAYWDSAAHDWRVDPGRFVIHVGNSSTTTPLTADVSIRP